MYLSLRCFWETQPSSVNRFNRFLKRSDSHEWFIYESDMVIFNLTRRFKKNATLVPPIKPGIHCAIFVRFWAEFWLMRLFFWLGPNFSVVVRRCSCSVRAVYRGKREAISLSRQAIGRSDEFLTCQKFWSLLVRVSHSWSRAKNRLP